MRAWIGLCAALLLVVTAQADVYTLNADGTGDYPNIQAAVSACQDGDVIQLEDGTYTGTGNGEIDLMGRTITICSVSGNPEACILDFEGIHGNYISEVGFYIDSGEGPETMIKDLTLRNGDGDAG